jgi:hypothetical protein
VDVPVDVAVDADVDLIGLNWIGWIGLIKLDLDWIN